MSDHYDLLRESLREMQSLVDEARADGSRPEHELLEAEKEIAQTYQQIEEWLRCDAELEAPPSAKALAMEALADWLAARQGTFMPDFEALYRRKAELDGEI